MTRNAEFASGVASARAATMLPPPGTYDDDNHDTHHTSSQLFEASMHAAVE